MISGAEVFLDTSILLYAALGKVDAPEKFAIARRIVLEEDYCTSAQVLSEFFVAVTHNGERPLSTESADQWVAAIARKPCQSMDPQIVRAGIEFAQRHPLSYRDGAIIAAAERLGSRRVYSEVLNHGQTYGEVMVVNPFVQS